MSEFTFALDYRETLARGTKGHDRDTRVRNPQFIPSGTPLAISDILHKSRVRILTFGANAPSPNLTHWLDSSHRSTDRLTLLVDVAQTISLDRWEDLLWAQDEPRGLRMGAILIRPGASLPDTFYAIREPLQVPVAMATLGTWQTAHRNPRCNWAFPSRWSFPDWIRDRLPVRKDTSRGFTFEQLSVAGLDSLLAEYAGLIDRGNAFRLDPDSALPENIRSYLRFKYGGQHGLKTQCDLWALAMDLKNQGETTTHQFGYHLRPAYRAGKRVMADGKPDWELAPQTQGRRAVDLAAADESIRDAIFMGSVDDPAAQNLREKNRTFLLNGRQVRRYHEGSTFLRKRYDVRMDDDPSDMITCGQVRSRADLHARAAQAPPEGLATFEEWDWVPSTEHLQSFKASLLAHNTDAQEVPQSAGYWKTWEENGELQTEFIPLSLWLRHWDADKGAMVAGKSESMSSAEKRQWRYAKGGTWLVWADADGEPHAHLFAKADRPDVLPTQTERQKIVTRPGDLPERALAKAYWFNRKKGTYENPRSFIGSNGETVHLKPRPLTFDRTAWGTYRRCWTALETVRKLLAEERWEFLAFDHLAAQGSSGDYASDHRFTDEAALFDTDAQRKAEATIRIYAHLDDLNQQIVEANLDTDVKETFTADLTAVRDQVLPCVEGARDPDPPTTLENLNPPVESTPRRKAQAEDPVHAAAAIGVYRSLWATYTRMARECPKRKTWYAAMAARMLWLATGKQGPEPQGPPTDPITGRPTRFAKVLTAHTRTQKCPLETRRIRKVKQSTVLALATAVVQLEGEDPARQSRAKRFLARHDSRKNTDALEYRYAGRVGYGYGLRLPRTRRKGLVLAPAGQK